MRDLAIFFFILTFAFWFAALLWARFDAARVGHYVQSLDRVVRIVARYDEFAAFRDRNSPCTE
jgi:hypothetical protein